MRKNGVSEGGVPIMTERQGYPEKRRFDENGRLNTEEIGLLLNIVHAHFDTEGRMLVQRLSDSEEVAWNALAEAQQELPELRVANESLAEYARDCHAESDRLRKALEEIKGRPHPTTGKWFRDRANEALEEVES